MQIELNEILKVVLKTSISFVVLLISIRLLGKKQIGHLTFFNYITGITIGSIAANIISFTDEPFIYGLIGLICWCLLNVMIDYINLKSNKIRTLIDGEPTLVIKNGKILKKALASARINLADLTMILREKNIFSLKEVDYAIVEPNGRISVLKKQAEQPITKADLKIPIMPAQYLPTKIISDGQLIPNSLKELKLNQTWLENELNAQGITSINEVFYAEIETNGSLFVECNQDSLQ